LHEQRHAFDFVEEQCATVASSILPARALRPVKAPCSYRIVRFPKASQETGTIDGCKGTVPARAVIVDSTRDQLFPGSGFALDEHGHIRRSDHADNLKTRCISGSCSTFRRFTATLSVRRSWRISIKPAPFPTPLLWTPESLRRRMLHNKITRATLEHLDGAINGRVAVITMTGHQGTFSLSPRSGPPANPRKPDIGDHQIDVSFLQSL